MALFKLQKHSLLLITTEQLHHTLKERPIKVGPKKKNPVDFKLAWWSERNPTEIVLNISALNSSYEPPIVTTMVD